MAEPEKRNPGSKKAREAITRHLRLADLARMMDQAFSHYKTSEKWTSA